MRVVRTQESIPPTRLPPLSRLGFKTGGAGISATLNSWKWFSSQLTISNTSTPGPGVSWHPLYVLIASEPRLVDRPATSLAIERKFTGN
jgi:hypothetical protein